ncbi:hypothetical protein GIY56_15785 [Paracoccus sp. YIM 132242]|uniref:Glycosyl transferase n=1 Tax=Paracoccus lichenicola TaxID=2665644 RepID=A0A6L6HU34_9RHOB|nr:hypothetical protein [Paracoccus lichenicola]MTE01751.1 hypothetical protein [Paracoccus lichenicola]
MKIAIYTSCALNYYAKALALVQSARRNSPGASVTLCLCDALPPGIDPMADGFARCWTPADLGYDEGWIFQHNIMELCTAVKGRALVELMKAEPDADLYVYLDPDVYIYNDLSAVADYLGNASIGLVPHILSVETTDIGVRLTEMSVTEHGIYNLGHLFVRPDANGRALAKWWMERLDRYCFDDREFGLFTDQRWMDLVPAVFDGVCILKQPNLDVASWNLSGRRIWMDAQPDVGPDGTGDERNFRVDDYPLLTYHFSGTGPSGTHRRIREIFDPANGAIAEIERRYEQAIARNGQARLEHVPPAHDLFDDGTPVAAEMRKIYRLSTDLQGAFPHPYRTEGSGTLAEWMRRNQPSLGKLGVKAFRLNRSFEELFDADYYARTYPDAAAAVESGMVPSAIAHYVAIGSGLFYDPNEFFVSRDYFARAGNLDRHVLRGRCGRGRENTLLWHYLTVGLPNGIEPIDYFDSRWYLDHYPDVADAIRKGRIGTALQHFLTWGSKENRLPGPSFMPSLHPQPDPEQTDARGAFGLFLRNNGVTGRISVRD